VRPAATRLAALFVPFAVLAGVQRAEAPQTASLTGAIAGALAALALFLWAVDEWRRRGGAGEWR
jgi:hypothetical protein